MRWLLLLSSFAACASTTPTPGSSVHATPPATTAKPPVAVRASTTLDAALASDDALKEEALVALGASHRADARDKLVGALKAEKGELRFAAAQGLSHLRDPSAGDAIAAAFRKEKGWAVRKELAAAAGACQVRQLIPDLDKALADPKLRMSAAWALDELHVASGTEILKQLGSPPRPSLVREGADRWSRKVLGGEKEGDKRLAVRSLAEMGNASDVPLLESLLGSDDKVLGTWAAAAILAVQQKPAPPPGG